MIKKHKKSKVPLMRRSARVFLNDLNTGKQQTLTEFLYLCHDVTQYFVDLFWQRQDFSAKLADLETVHKGCDKFGITTRLAQALAKQAKEIVRSGKEKRNRKPRLRYHTTTLYYHFITIEAFDSPGFDYAVNFTGSGAPRLTVPVHSTKPINKFLSEDWKLSKTIRLGLKKGRLFIDFLFEKPRPPKKETGNIVGMDSNYKNGFVFSDGQQVGQEQYEQIRSFPKRRKHTHQRIKELIGQSLKQVDFSNIKMLCIENLKHVKRGTRGTFSRQHNRRLSHWQYAYVDDLLSRKCEEAGIRLERKDPYKTSQYCRICNKWDRRNRRGDKFVCVHCGHSEHADHNASKNLELLGLAGVYGLHLLPN